MYQALHKLYDLATSTIPMSASNRHSSEYTQLWLDLAALRAEDDPDEAAALFKRMKSLRIGQNIPQFWQAWADLEASLHNYDRATRFRKEASLCANVDPPPTPVPTSANVSTAKRKLPLRPPRRVGASNAAEEERQFSVKTDAEQLASDSVQRSSSRGAQRSYSSLSQDVPTIPLATEEGASSDTQNLPENLSPEVLRSSRHDHAREDVPQIFTSPHDMEDLRTRKRIASTVGGDGVREHTGNLELQDRPAGLVDTRESGLERQLEAGGEQISNKSTMEREFSQRMMLMTPVEGQQKLDSSGYSRMGDINRSKYHGQRNLGLGSFDMNHQSISLKQAETPTFIERRQGTPCDAGKLEKFDLSGKDSKSDCRQENTFGRTGALGYMSHDDRPHSSSSKQSEARNATEPIYCQGRSGEEKHKVDTSSLTNSEKRFQNPYRNSIYTPEGNHHYMMSAERIRISSDSKGKQDDEVDRNTQEKLKTSLSSVSEVRYRREQVQRRYLGSELHGERPHPTDFGQLNSPILVGERKTEGSKGNENLELKRDLYVSPEYRYHSEYGKNDDSGSRPQRERHLPSRPRHNAISSVIKHGELATLHGERKGPTSQPKWGTHDDRSKEESNGVPYNNDTKCSEEGNNGFPSNRQTSHGVSRGSPSSYSNGHDNCPGTVEGSGSSQTTSMNNRCARIIHFLHGIHPDSLVTVNQRPYLILEMVGKGGSSKVFKVLSHDMKILALKRVKVPSGCTNFNATIDSYANEIGLLKKLRGSPTIIELFDAEVRKETGMIQLIMEYGDIDLAKLLLREKGKTINDNFRRMYWQQMLEAVHTIHEARIIHGDLKPANFLIVGGTLKLIDFGIAKAIVAEDTTKIVRDSQVGTPNYMSPEALMCDGDEPEGEGYESSGAEESDHKGSGRDRGSTVRRYKVGRGSDIWSLGCILYQMVYGRAPFAHIRNTIQKLACIQNPDFEIVYKKVDNKLVLDVLRGCLQRDPERRMSIPQLLQHGFLCGDGGGKGRPGLGGTDGSAGVGTSCDVRLVIYKVFELLQKQGYEKMVIEGRTVNLVKGDDVFENVVRGLVQELGGGKKGQGGCGEGATTEIGLSARKERNGKGIRTPTASAVTTSGGVIKI